MKRIKMIIIDKVLSKYNNNICSAPSIDGKYIAYVLCCVCVVCCVCVCVRGDLKCNTRSAIHRVR